MLRLTGLFIWPVSDILLSPLHAPLRLCLRPDLEVTTQRWIKATFHQRVNTTHPTHHSGQLKTHGASVGLLPFSDKNNN